MVVVNLKGGVGNQMFQIATGYALSLRCHTSFAINYNLPFTCGQGKHPSYYKDTFYKHIEATTHIPTNKYVEPCFGYKDIPQHADILLDGYFQSELYFNDYKNDIKQLFFFPEQVKLKVDNFLKQYNNPVGVHIRLGDYKNLKDFHPIQSKEYINNAIDIIGKDKSYIVCSDDWEALKISDKFIKSPFTDELEDLYMLSCCSSVIMSNSSFSWWGSYLGKDKDFVICPSKCFGYSGPQDYETVYCKDWIRL